MVSYETNMVSYETNMVSYETNMVSYETIVHFGGDARELMCHVAWRIRGTWHSVFTRQSIAYQWYVI